jgi:CubicO group peptidase (beta-lactamase class C family)
MKSEISQPVTTPSAKRDQFKAVYQVLGDAITAHAFPGCAFGVLAHGDVVLQDALGSFTYDADSPAVTADTIYDLASVTKAVATTAAAMLLHQRGLLDLDAPLGELLPGFVAASPVGTQLGTARLRGVLSHHRYRARTVSRFIGTAAGGRARRKS